MSHDAALAHLRAADPRMAAMIDRIGEPGLEVAIEGSVFQHLARSIVFQQLSGKAAGTIHGRFAALFPDGVPTPEGLEALDDEALRGAGLSRQKIASIRALGEHMRGRDLRFEHMAGLTDDEIVADLTRIRGIGRWTVEMMLLFRLGRPDVLAVDDLGIQRGLMRTLGLPEMPKPKQVKALAEPFAPYRSLASWYLWRISDLKNEDLPGG